MSESTTSDPNAPGSNAPGPSALDTREATVLNDWVSRQADEVIATAERLRAEGRLSPEAPIVCASGLSPSGPIHLGNLREVMVPHLVADEIKRRGIPCEHILSWDDYDRFRKVPRGIPGIESWDEHIGKPYTAVPAPPGSAYVNWAEHFKAAMKESLAEMGVDFRGISQSEMYQSGAYVDQVLQAMAGRTLLDKILDQYRTKAREAEAAQQATGKGKPGSPGPATNDGPINADDEAMAAALAEEGSVADDEDGVVAGKEWYPFKPFCHVCETDFTEVTAYDDETSVLTYTCRCGHSQEMDLTTDHKGKLVWKIDWPMRWGYEQVLFEPSGVDHQSPGSSFTVGRDVAPVFGWQRPIGPMYAFVGIAGMAKMSSSKGGVPTPSDALQIMEPALLRWLYARKRPNQAFTIAFDGEIQRLYDEWDALVRKLDAGTAQPGDVAAFARSAGTAAPDGTVRRLPLTLVPLPYRAMASAADITGGDEEQMLRILGGMTAQPLDSLDVLRPRLDKAMTWVETRMPAEDRTRVRDEPDAELLAGLDETDRGALALLNEHLEDDWSLEGLTTLVYGVPKLQAGLDIHEKKLPAEVKAAQKSFFALLYRLLVDAETGPRLPTLLLCLGSERMRRLTS